MRQLIFAVCLLFTLSSYAGDKLTIAAASDLRYAMADIVSLFQQQTQLDVRVIYGASGKLSTQIRHGAPYDIFFPPISALPGSYTRMAWQPLRHSLMHRGI